jgi:hypothetical protein
VFGFCTVNFPLCVFLRQFSEKETKSPLRHLLQQFLDKMEPKQQLTEEASQPSATKGMV